MKFFYLSKEQSSYYLPKTRVLMNHLTLKRVCKLSMYFRYTLKNNLGANYPQEKVC